MAKIDAIDVPKLTYPEAAAPSTPASGKVVTYAKADGLMYSKDDAGAETLMSSGSGSGGVTVQDEGSPLSTVGTTLNFTGAGVTASGSGATKTVNVPGATVGGYDNKKYVGGDVALTGTSMTAVSGPTDLVVAAAAGDVLLVGLSVSPVTTTGASIAFDFATMNGSTPVNYIGTASGTPINIPVNMWLIGSGETSGCGGAFPYVVQAGDIFSGNVTIRLYARVSANRSINADASNPLHTWVKNLLH